LLIDNSAEDGGFWKDVSYTKIEMNCLDLFALLKRYTEQRQIVKQLENQLKCVTLKTKSQRWTFYFNILNKLSSVLYSQQIQDQRQRRLNSADRAAKLVSSQWTKNIMTDLWSLA
jgi:hypothetical protein